MVPEIFVWRKAQMQRDIRIILRMRFFTVYFVVNLLKLLRTETYTVVFRKEYVQFLNNIRELGTLYISYMYVNRTYAVKEC